MTVQKHFTLTDRRKMLKWKQRMTIMIGIARGIQYLHRGVNNGIFGNNLKIENILLDNNLNPKVSGYSIPFPSKVRKTNYYVII
jgi:serine/threonine protein kinase